MNEKPERPFPMIAEILDDIFGPAKEDEPEELQEYRKSVIRNGDNTNVV